MGDPDSLAKRLDELVQENYALKDDLQQCRTDKDFVWNLWKRLQAAKPDLASVVSMVLSREKEKSEKKDQKILQILQMKDEKIKELREALDESVTEMKQTKERFHDLLIENDELKQKQDEKESELSQRTKTAEDQNQYLSQLVKAYQDEKDKGDQDLKNNLETIEGEKNVLRSQIQNLESQIGKLSEDKASFDSVMETNTALQGQMQELQKQVEELTAKTEEREREHEGALSALKLREAQLQDEKKDSHFLSGEVRDKEKELIRLRAEVADLKNEYDKALEHIHEQVAVIERMQRMQEQMHRAMTDRNQTQERDTLELQKSIAELQARCTEDQVREGKLQQRLAELQERLELLRESDEKHIQELTKKDHLIEELKEALSNTTRTKSPAAKRAKRESVTPCRNCRNLKEKLEDHELEREELGQVINEKTRRISSLERTLKSALTKQKGTEVRLSNSPETTHTECKTTDTEERHDFLSSKLERTETRNKDLKKLLELKDFELTEVRRAHSQRQQRYKLLKDNHNLVLSQLRTYEKEQKEQSPVERPAERALRHHNSDGVWNELTHYKSEYEKLEKERHDVLEELDVLRVQRANDLTTIQELKLCLQEEKDVLLDRLTSEEEKRDSRTAQEVKKLERKDEELAKWKDKAVRSEKLAAEFNDEIELTKQESESFQRENSRLKEDVLSLKTDLEAANRDLNERMRECVKLRKETEGQREEMDRILRDTRSNRQPKDLKKDSVEESPANKHLEQQAKNLDMYDEQLKKIAERIISPRKQPSESPPTPSYQPLRTSHGTQTIEVPHTADFSATVDMGAESTDEGGDGMESDVGGKGKFGVGTPKKSTVPQTPGSKMKGGVTKRTPARSGEWASMKQRVLSLTQQVAALRNAKDKAVKSLADERTTTENLQSELNIVLQRLQVSKNTVQTLSEDLKKCVKEKEALLLEKESLQVEGNEEETKRLQERLKVSGSECSRLGYIVKTLRAELSELKDKLKDSQDRASRAERDASQKKTLIEEMKTKLRKFHGQEEKEADAVKDLEEKIRRLVERENQRKLQTDSLKRQLDAETKEKEKFQQQYYSTQEELKKKTRLLSESRVLRGQAEMAVSEMEAAATHQLQGLANQSQAAISTIQVKLDKASGKVEEFQAFVKTLADELIADIKKTARATARIEDERKIEDQRKPTSQHARDTACSILNLTTSDLEDLMRDDDVKDSENRARKKKETDWKNRLNISLKKEVPFAVALLEIILDIVEERLVLAHRHSDASRDRNS